MDQIFNTGHNDDFESAKLQKMWYVLFPRITLICAYLHLFFFFLYITPICLEEENILGNAFFVLKSVKSDI